MPDKHRAKHRGLSRADVAAVLKDSPSPAKVVDHRRRFAEQENITASNTHSANESLNGSVFQARTGSGETEFYY